MSSPEIKYLTMYCKCNYRIIGKMGWPTFLHKSAAHMRKSGYKNVFIIGVCTVQSACERLGCFRDTDALS